MVLFESCLAAAGYRRSIEMHLLTPLAKVMLGVLAVFMLVRFGDLLWRGALGHAFAANLQAFMFWLETACFLSPFVLLRSERQRRNPARLFVGGALLMLGGVLLRHQRLSGRLRHRQRLVLLPLGARAAGDHRHVRDRGARLHRHHPPLPGAAARTRAPTATPAALRAATR